MVSSLQNHISLHCTMFCQCLTGSKFHILGSYVLQFADDFAYTDPVSLNNCICFPFLLDVLYYFNQLLLEYCSSLHLYCTKWFRLMEVWHQSKVFGLSSWMDQGSYSAYQYGPTFLSPCEIEGSYATMT